MESLVQVQEELERRYDQNQVIPKLKKLIRESELLEQIRNAGLPEEFTVTALVHMVLLRRANVETLVGIMRKFYTTAQEVADMLKLLVEKDFIDFNEVFITKYLISEEVQKELDRYQFPLPMVIRPLKVRNNFDTGYLTNRQSIILNKNSTDEDVCLDHINRINRIALRLNMDTAYFVKNKWRNLDHKKVDETYDEYLARKKQFAKYNETTLFDYELLNQFTDKIYLTHAYDKRGRIYCRGYHLNYQAGDWNKAVVEFYKEEKVNG